MNFHQVTAELVQLFHLAYNLRQIELKLKLLEDLNHFNPIVIGISPKYYFGKVITS